MNNKLFLKHLILFILTYNYGFHVQATNICQEFVTEPESLVTKIQNLTNLRDISLQTHVEKLKILDALQSTLQNDPKNLEALKTYVLVSNSLIRKSNAFAKLHLEVLAQLITIEGPSNENLELLFSALIENKKFSEAEAIAKMLISKNTNKPSYSQMLLYALKRQGRFTELVDLGNSALRNHPNQIEIIDLVVQAHRELFRELEKYDSTKANDHLQSAKDLLKQLVRQNLADSKHYIQLGQILYSLGQYQEILDLLELATYAGVEVEKTQAEILRIRAYTRLEYFDLAESLLESLHYQNPDTTFIQNLKSWFRDYLSKYNRKQKALRLRQEAELLNPLIEEKDSE